MLNEKQQDEFVRSLLRQLAKHQKYNGEITVEDRHTRHFHNAKQILSYEYWEVLKYCAETEFGVDVEELAWRGEAYIRDHPDLSFQYEEDDDTMTDQHHSKMDGLAAPAAVIAGSLLVVFFGVHQGSAISASIGSLAFAYAVYSAYSRMEGDPDD